MRPAIHFHQFPVRLHIVEEGPACIRALGGFDGVAHDARATEPAIL
jgi:hypothetical protein